MFRSKAEVDRHVADILHKIHNENEKKLRGFTFARLYNQVKDFETAKKYLTGYLSVRDHHAPSHKLMAQLYEASGNLDKALQCYKRSLEVDAKQRDIVLKICELYCKLPVDHETARYWADRADQLFPHHEIVFGLRECIVSGEGEPDRKELERLITTELAAQPYNLSIRMKLLHLYLDTERVKEAYVHATKVEKKKPFPNSMEWYYMLVDIFEAYQNEPDQELDFNFYIMFLSALDHLVYLTLAEPHAISGKALSTSNDDVASVVLQFDQHLKKAVNKDLMHGSWLYFLHHMKGQLYFHLGTLLLKRAKKEQGNWKETCRVATALFLIGYSFKPANLLQEIWFSQMEEQQQQFTKFFQQGSLRTSFIGHAVISLCKEDKNKWLKKIKHDVCLPQVQERTFNRLFSCTNQKLNSSESYFLNDTTFVNSNLEFPTLLTLQEYDSAAFKLCSHSLHHLIWLQMSQNVKESQNRNEEKSKHGTYRNSLFEAFKGLQYNNNNLSKGNPESLCLLDIEAFLLATLYTTSLFLDEKCAVLNNKHGDTTLSVPPDISEYLCTLQQAKWWKAAHDLVNNNVKVNLGEQRRTLLHGLEVIRGIGNHGLEIQLVVHLARAFADQATTLSSDNNTNDTGFGEKIGSSKVTALESRAVHYWSIVLNMLEKLESHHALPIPKDHLFVGISTTLSKDEISTLREEGKLYLACRFMNSGKLESAIDILEKLSSPYASYYLALTYKKMAFQESTTTTKTALQNKVRDALYLTMDRIKGENTHPLNRDVYLEVEDIENEIGNNKNFSNMNDTTESESVDGCNSVETSFRLNSRNGTPVSSKQNRITHHSTPRPSATFMSSKNQYLNSIARAHVEPSPERLDAQIRSLALTQSTLVSTMLEQQRSLLDSNKAIVEQLKANTDVVIQLKKSLDELKISNSKQYRPSNKKHPHVSVGQGDEEGTDEEEYDPNGYSEYYVDDNVEEYQQAGYAFPHSGRAITDSSSSLGYVPPPSALPPAHYSYQYPPPPPHPGLCPPGTIPETAHYYHTPINHGLPFSEGQQLPQFKFHVASPVVKPAVMNVGSVPQPILHGIMPQQSAVPTILPPASQPSMSWAKPSLVPHAFQIPLPTDPTTPSSTSQAAVISAPVVSVVPATIALTTTPLSSNVKDANSCDSPILLNALLQGSSAPTIPGTTPTAPATSSEAFSFKSPVSTDTSHVFQCSPDTSNLHRSRKDSEAYSDTDVEKEVMGNFKPVIPLPAEVIVETGEEDEMALFEDRAKLFRFVEREWKERGIGVMKILRHKETGVIRLLMRRDQVLKICANHRISPNMSIQYLKGSDKALTWTAHDFADETVKVEQFCIRFKTPEIVQTFKRAFEDSVLFIKSKESADNKSSDIVPIINGIIDDAVELTTPGFGAEFLPKPGSWSCAICCLNNSADKVLCAACETPKPGLSKSAELFNAINSPFALPSLPVISPVPNNFVSDASNSKHITFPTPVNPKIDSTPPKPIPVSVQPNVTVSFPENQKPVFGNLSFSASNVFTKRGTGLDLNQSDAAFSKTNVQVPDSTSLFGNIALTSAISSFEKAKSGDVTKTTAPTIPYAGFTFSSAPVFIEKPEEPQDREILVVSTKSKEGPQVVKIDTQKLSPFANFRFNTDFSKTSPVKSEPFFKLSVDAALTNLSSTSISSPTKDSPSQSFSNAIGSPYVVTVTKDGRRVSAEHVESTPEDFVPTAEFKPVIPLPALVDVKTGEESEEKLFGERAKLFRYNSELKEWKERGVGELKILYSPTDGKFRIVMRRDQVLKLCANHYILPGMKLSALQSSDKSWVWYAQDFSDGDLKQEQFAAKFKNSEIAQRFQESFETCYRLVVETKKLEDKSSEVNSAVSKNKSEIDNPCLANKSNFSDMFKPDPNSWECTACYIRNIDTNSCVACKSEKPGMQSTITVSSPKQKPGFWECQSCQFKNEANASVCTTCKAVKGSLEILAKDTTTSGSNMKPLSELFKPDPLSWECDSCYVRNDGTLNSCSACQTPKPGVVVTKESTSTFKFGMLATSSDTKSIFGSSTVTSSGSGFIFGTNTDSNSLPTFKFGTTTLTPPTGFVPNFSTTKPTEGKAVFGGGPFMTTIPPVTTTSSTAFNSFFPKHSDLAIPPVTAAPTFVFGKPSPSILQLPISTSVSSNQEQTVAFTFGSVKDSGDSKEEQDDFQFGSPQKYEFNFSGVRPRSPPKSLKSPKSPTSPNDADDDDEVQPSDVDNIYFQPVIPLPPKVELKTGEEDEEVLFSSRAKLFRFTDGEWKERGIGDVKILHNVLQKKVRLLMRREQVLKVCLNHYLKNDMEFTWKSDKSLSWAAMDFSENEPNLEQFAIRFKTAELAKQFHKILDSTMKDLLGGTTISSSPQSAVKDEKPSAIGTEGFSQKLSSFSFMLGSKSPKSSAFDLSSRLGTSPGKTPFFSNPSTMTVADFKSTLNDSKQDSDIEIVHEVKVSPEQAAAAVALKLPPNFYAYESKVPCPGCIGCEKVMPSQPSKKEETKDKEPKEDKKVESTQPPTNNEALNLFSHSSLSTFSFAELVNEKTGFSALESSSTSFTTFPGAGQRLFESATAHGDNEDGEVVENPDIHFEPIIPLPNLVEVKTGEEDEIPIFCYRAKLYRYDTTSSQWKERGTGDMKILQHREKCRFRLLHRRELVHKVACNHLISENLELKPLATSNNSLCWSAIDYSEGKPDQSQFAIKFKNENILKEFKSKFEECKARLSSFKTADPGDSDANKDLPPAMQEGPTQEQQIQETEPVAIVEVAHTPSASESTSSSESVEYPEEAVTILDITNQSTIRSLGMYQYYPDEALGAVGLDPSYGVPAEFLEYSDDEDEEDEDIIFDERVSFEVYNEAAKKFEDVGTGSLKVLYDDTVFGYKIQFTDDSKEVLSDHIIAIQTCLRTTNCTGTWAAIDMIEPPKRRQFRASFATKTALDDFVKVFEDGKQIAVEAEIVERGENIGD